MALDDVWDVAKLFTKGSLNVQALASVSLTIDAGELAALEGATCSRPWPGSGALPWSLRPTMPGWPRERCGGSPCGDGAIVDGAVAEGVSS